MVNEKFVANPLSNNDLNNSLENLTQVLKILPTDLNKQMQEVMKLGKEAIEKSKNVNPYQIFFVIVKDKINKFFDYIVHELIGQNRIMMTT